MSVTIPSIFSKRSFGEKFEVNLIFLSDTSCGQDREGKKEKNSLLIAFVDDVVFQDHNSSRYMHIYYSRAVLLAFAL